MKKLIFIFSILIIFLSSCKKQNTTPAANTSDNTTQTITSSSTSSSSENTATQTEPAKQEDEVDEFDFSYEEYNDSKNPGLRPFFKPLKEAETYEKPEADILIEADSTQSLITYFQNNSIDSSSKYEIVLTNPDENYLTYKWTNDVLPSLQKMNIACLDFSRCAKTEFNSREYFNNVKVQDLYLPEDEAVYNDNLLYNIPEVHNAIKINPPKDWNIVGSPNEYIKHIIISQKTEDFFANHKYSYIVDIESVIFLDKTCSLNEYYDYFDQVKLKDIYGDKLISLTPKNPEIQKHFILVNKPEPYSNQDNLFLEIPKDEYSEVLQLCNDCLLYKDKETEIHLFISHLNRWTEYSENMEYKFILIKTKKEEKLYICKYKYSGFVSDIKKVYESKINNSTYFSITHVSQPNGATNGFKDICSELIQVKDSKIIPLFIYQEHYEDIESGQNGKINFFENDGHVYATYSSHYLCGPCPQHLKLWIEDITDGLETISHEESDIFTTFFNGEESVVYMIEENTPGYSMPDENSKIVMTFNKNTPIYKIIELPEYSGNGKEGSWFIKIVIRNPDNYRDNSNSCWIKSDAMSSLENNSF